MNNPARHNLDDVTLRAEDGEIVIETDEGDIVGTVSGDLNIEGLLSAENAEVTALEAEQLGSERHYAGSYEGSDADTRLDNALLAASDGDVIYLENADYSANRTIDTRLTIIGTSVAYRDGSNIVGEWTLDQRTVVERISLDGDGQINLNNSRCKLINTDGVSGSTIDVNDNQTILYGIVSSSVTFAADTDRSIIDASSSTDVTDNGENTVGDIA